MTGATRFKHGLRRFTNRAERIQLIAAAMLLVVLITVTSADITSRLIRNSSLFWANEVARLCFLWSSFLAAAPMFRRSEHLAIDLITFEEDALLGRIQHGVITLLNVVFAGAFAYIGILIAREEVTRTFPIIGWPISVGWFSIPVMGATALLYVLEAELNGPPPPRTRPSDEQEPQPEPVLEAIPGHEA